MDSQADMEGGACGQRRHLSSGFHSRDMGTSALAKSGNARVVSLIDSYPRTQHLHVLLDAGDLVDDFEQAVEQLDLPGWPCRLDHEMLPAPHKQRHPPRGYGAIYAFALSGNTISTAGARMVSKVGRVGAKSDPRFYSQHYTLSARSTLAKSLISHQVPWPWLGISDLDSANVKPWMLANLDRLHIFVPAESPGVLPVLEMYVRARVGSVFEGSA